MSGIPKRLQDSSNRFLLLKERSKEPISGVRWKENLFAFDDPKLLKHIADGGNVGLALGHGRVRATDIDKPEYAETVFDDFNTFTDRTGGRGSHFIYKSDYDKNHKLKDGIGEIRSKDMYIVIPPSMHPNGNRYDVFDDRPIREIPEDELKSIIRKLLAPKVEKTVAAEGPTRPHTLPDNIDMLIRSGVPQGERHMNVWIITKELFNRGFTKSEILENVLFFNQKCQPSKDVQTVKSHVEYLLSNAERYLADEWATKNNYGVEAVTETPLVVLSGSQLEELDLPKIDWLIEGVVPAKGMTVLAAKGKSYKTTMAVRMCASIVRGEDFYGLAVKQGRVLYFDAEIGPSAFKSRLNMIKDGMGAPDLNELYSVFPLMNKNKLARIDTREGVKAIERTIEEVKPVLVVFDVLRRFHRAKEDKADEINAMFADYLLPLVERQNVAVLAVFHNRKGGVEKPKVSPFDVDSLDMLDEIRGSSELVNIAESVILLKRFGRKSPFFAFYSIPRNAEERDKFFRADFDTNEQTIVITEVDKETIELEQDIEDNTKLMQTVEWIKDREEFKTYELKTLFTPKLSNEQADRLLQRLLESGSIAKKRRGEYIVTSVTNGTLEGYK